MSDNSSDKPKLDLKARLNLGAKSLRAQQREEEEKRQREEDERARQEAEAKKKQDRESQVDKFSLAGAGPARTEWSQAIEIPEEELAALETMPSAGRKRRGAVVGIIVIIAMLFAAAVGYYFGRAFFGRSHENYRIEEAKTMLDYLEKGSKIDMKLIEEHKAAILDLVETFEKPNLDPKFQLRALYEFMDKCEKFLEKQRPIAVREVFSRQIYNFDIIPDVVTYVESVNRLLVMTDRFLQERMILRIIGTGEDTDDKPTPMSVSLIFESDPQGEGEVKIPWNKGQIVQLAGEVKLAERGVAATDTLPAKPPKFTIPVKTSDGKGLEAETGTVVQFDAWPVIRRQEGIYRMALLERTKGNLLDLNAVAQKVNFARAKKKLEEYSIKEPYFTF